MHDNPLHHRGQAAMIDTIDPAAVVFEQLSVRAGDVANATPRDDLTAFGEAIRWDDSGWPPFRIYAVIFDALDDAAIVGMAEPFGQARAAFSDGAAATFGPAAEAYGLNSALDAKEQTRREQLQFNAHCAAMPLEMMGGMVEAQRYRDAVFARAIKQAHETHGGPVAVILGHGHARKDWGVPRYLERIAPDLSVYSVGFVETGARDLPFDLRIETEAAVRSDPCGTLAPKT